MQRAAVFAALVASVPIVVGLAVQSPAHNVASPSTCSINQSGNSSSITCSPGMSPGVSGAPSEQDITAKNQARLHGGGLYF